MAGERLDNLKRDNLQPSNAARDLGAADQAADRDEPLKSRWSSLLSGGKAEEYIVGGRKASRILPLQTREDRDTDNSRGPPRRRSR